MNDPTLTTAGKACIAALYSGDRDLALAMALVDFKHIRDDYDRRCFARLLIDPAWNRPPDRLVSLS